MDNMIKKFNEELKYYFPESRLEAVLFEIPLSKSKSIDIRGDLNVMEFYKFLNFNKIWITENLQKYFHVENWKDYNVHPQKAGLDTFTKIAFTNEEAQKRGCMNMQYFDPILYTEVVFTETTEFKVQHPLQIFYMSVYIIFDAFIKRYEDMLLAHKEAKDVESLTPESAKKYTAIITSEPDGKGLDYISDHPWEGNLEATKEFDTVEELYEFEGLFYQLFANKSGRRIGYGMVNDEYPAADIREFEKTQNPKQGQLIIISGFSRAGKDAIADGLKELSDNYIYSVSATTRQPRPGERKEVDYFFITPECFANLEESGGFLESAEYCGNKYGTPASNVFAADEVQEVAVFDDGSETTETDNAVNTEDNFANADFENGNTGIETQGIITTDYIVTASSLNVRSGRGKDYPIIGSLSKGQTVKVYNNSLDDNWVKIKFSGSTGYVSASFIKKK